MKGVSQKQTQIFKIMLLGDTSTGKTSFITELMHRIPQRLPKPTSQLSFFTLKISKPPTIIQVWDSPGNPKYHLQTVGSLAGFKCVLLFIDITNDHTFQRANVIVDQLNLYKNLDIHIIKIKDETVEKDPFKRKVSDKMIEDLSQRLGGQVFEYRLNRGVEETLQKIIEWQRPKIMSKTKTKSKWNYNVKQVQQMVFEKEKEPVCQCNIF